MATDTQIEQEIVSKGLTRPRVTPKDVEDNIRAEHYFTAADGYAGCEALTVEQDGIISPPVELELLTFCVLILKNGYTVTGESACASPENFDFEVGKKVARQNAVNKIWPLMGYELKTKIAGV